MSESVVAPPTQQPRVATLNENHARRIVSTFAHVDGLLRGVERLAHAQGAPRSEFAREQPDLSETEAHLLLSLVDTARRRMLATLDHLGLPRPNANLSARWNVMTTLRFVDISLSELTTKTLSGYGAIDAGSGAEVAAVASELRELIARGREVLQPHEGEALRERLKDIQGPLGEVLRGAEELSTRLGLVQVRPLIAAAAERAATSTIDIGIFGRVSSGKSSLINALAGAPLLPVGATPVTAVPLRVTHGADAIEIQFADGRRTSIDSTELPEYATEAGNRDNARHVQSILIHTPLLPEGLVLLDTPGVGSLSQSGPAQAFAWLPRCDLGLVLVAAGTPLGRDELALVGGLTHAGIAVEVLLSKSDLISEAERAAAVDYVATEIARATGVSNISVRPVSVTDSAKHLLDRWRDERLVPLVAARERIREASRARRARALLGALDAALIDRPALDLSKIDLHRARADAEREIGAAADELEAAAKPGVSQAIDAVAAAWRSGEDARNAARNALLEAPNRALLRARTVADQLLNRAETFADDDTAGRIPPLFDPGFLDALPLPERSSVLDRSFPSARARQRLAGLAQSVDDAYGTYANRVRAWGLERLDEAFERIASVRSAEISDVAPELQELARLIATHFPAAA